MPTGGCFCDKVRISFTGAPKAQKLCHCTDCKKISGGSYSNNIIVAEGDFKLESGKPKSISKIGDTGNEIVSHFCGDCGTTLTRTGTSFPGLVIIKAGVLDDWKWVNDNPPTAELFSPERATWIPALPNAEQVKTMS